MRIKITSERTKKEPKRSLKKVEQCCSEGKSSQECSAYAEKEEQVRKKAYELFEQRGCQPGHEWEDWFEAKKMCGIR